MMNEQRVIYLSGKTVGWCEITSGIRMMCSLKLMNCLFLEFFYLIILDHDWSQVIEYSAELLQIRGRLYKSDMKEDTL